jgi:hypothetical protein
MTRKDNMNADQSATRATQINPGVLELRRIEVEMKKAETWNGVLPVNVYAGAPIPFFNATK